MLRCSPKTGKTHRKKSSELAEKKPFLYILEITARDRCLITSRNREEIASEQLGIWIFKTAVKRIDHFLYFIENRKVWMMNSCLAHLSFYSFCMTRKKLKIFTSIPATKILLTNCYLQVCFQFAESFRSFLEKIYNTYLLCLFS